MTAENERELAQLERTAAAALAESPRYLLVAQIDLIAPSGAFQPRGLRLLGPIADLVDAVHVAAGRLELLGEVDQAERLRATFKAATTAPAQAEAPPPAAPGTA